MGFNSAFKGLNQPSWDKMKAPNFSDLQNS